MDHFAGVTVDEAPEPIPRQRPLARRVTIQIAQARPSDILRDTAKIIPDKRFAILGPLVTRGVRAVRNQQN